MSVHRFTLLALVAASVVANSGCNNFENPLTWDESPAADGLPGSWRGVEGDDADTRAEVTRGDGGSFRIRMFKGEGDRHTAEFIADLVASETVQVLQIRMSTYLKGGDGLHGEVSRQGFRFRRATLTDTELTLQRLDYDMLGKLAEEALSDAGIRLKADTVVGCLGDDLTGSLWGMLWSYMSEQLDDDLEAKVLAALSNESPAKVEEELAKLADLEVDPYEELNKMRRCIALHLPSSPLGELLQLYADLVFVGSVNRYVRE